MSDYESGASGDEKDDINLDDGVRTSGQYSDEYDANTNVAIIVIDVCPSMFEADTDSKPFKVCLAACHEILNQMLLKRYRRNISVFLLQDQDFVLIDFKDNLVQSIKKIHDLLHLSISALQKLFERKTDVSLKDCFTEYMRLFRFMKKVNPHVIIMTNDPDPHKGDKRENLSSIHVAGDLRTAGVKLVVLPIVENFNYEPLYEALLKSANDLTSKDFTEAPQKTYTDVESLVDILESVIDAQAQVRRYPFYLGEKNNKPELKLWVQVHKLFQKTNLHLNTNVSRVTMHKLYQNYKNYASLDKKRGVIEQEGMNRVEIDRKSNKLIGEMQYGFKLLYVSEKQSSIHYLHKQPILVQQDESTPRSKRGRAQELFEYMWDYCKTKNKVLICGFFTPGNHQQPNMVELQPDYFNSKPCFIGVRLATFDQLNDVEDDSELLYQLQDAEHTKDEEEAFDKVIKSLKKKRFNPLDWTRPDYELTAAYIKADLLDTEVEEPEPSFPPESVIDKRLGAIAHQFQRTFGLSDNMFAEEKKGRKRKNPE